MTIKQIAALKKVESIDKDSCDRRHGKYLLNVKTHLDHFPADALYVLLVPRDAVSAVVGAEVLLQRLLELLEVAGRVEAAAAS